MADERNTNVNMRLMVQLKHEFERECKRFVEVWNFNIMTFKYLQFYNNDKIYPLTGKDMRIDPDSEFNRSLDSDIMPTNYNDYIIYCRDKLVNIIVSILGSETINYLYSILLNDYRQNGEITINLKLGKTEIDIIRDLRKRVVKQIFPVLAEDLTFWSDFEYFIFNLGKYIDIFVTYLDQQLPEDDE